MSITRHAPFLRVIERTALFGFHGSRQREANHANAWQVPASRDLALPTESVRVSGATGDEIVQEQLTHAPVHPQYWLEPHVHLCSTPEGIVFLDLKKDRYLGLGGNNLPDFRFFVEGWPCTLEETQLSSTYLREARDACERLVQEELFTTSSVHGKPADPVQIAALEDIPLENGDEGETHAHVRAAHVGVCLLSCARMAVSLRTRSLHSISETVRMRKARAGQRQACLASEPEVRRLVRIFDRIRPYLYTGKDHCLFHALALTNFLAFYGQFPTWVIGVRMDPFAAHSWVQHEGIVFDDYFDEVYSFTPIHAV